MCNLTQPVQQQKQKSSRPHTLYIIGNGFDLYHNLPTSYVNFRDYILNSEEYKQDAWLMYSIFNFTDYVNMLRKDIELIKKEHKTPFDVNDITKYQFDDCGHRVVVNNVGYLIDKEQILSSFDFNKINNRFIKKLNIT